MPLFSIPHEVIMFRRFSVAFLLAAVCVPQLAIAASYSTPEAAAKAFLDALNSGNIGVVEERLEVNVQWWLSDSDFRDFAKRSWALEGVIVEHPSERTQYNGQMYTGYFSAGDQ